MTAFAARDMVEAAAGSHRRIERDDIRLVHSRRF
jgi:hypothetical protein